MFRSAVGRAFWVISEVSLADERAAISGVRQGPAPTKFAELGIEAPVVIRHPMGERQHAGQDRRPGRLAHEVGRDRHGKVCASRGQTIKMGRSDLAPSEAVTIRSVLIGRDQ